MLNASLRAEASEHGTYSVQELVTSAKTTARLDQLRHEVLTGEGEE
jgi:hypothetical protein